VARKQSDGLSLRLIEPLRHGAIGRQAIRRGNVAIVVVGAGTRLLCHRSTRTNGTGAGHTTQIGSYDPDEIASVSITQA